jgi:hypothetical protein
MTYILFSFFCQAVILKKFGIFSFQRGSLVFLLTILHTARACLSPVISRRMIPKMAALTALARDSAQATPAPLKGPTSSAARVK